MSFDLVALFARLGLLSFGGGFAVLREMERELVDKLGSISREDFWYSFGLGQATPGPGMLFVIPLGYRIGGLATGIVLLAAFLIPPALLALSVTMLLRRASPDRVRTLQSMLAPIALGLAAGSALSSMQTVVHDVPAAAALIVSVVLLAVVRLHPTVVVVGLGVAGMVGASVVR